MLFDVARLYLMELISFWWNSIPFLVQQISIQPKFAILEDNLRNKNQSKNHEKLKNEDDPKNKDKLKQEEGLTITLDFFTTIKKP